MSYNLTSFIMKLFHFVLKTGLFYRPAEARAKPPPSPPPIYIANVGGGGLSPESPVKPRVCVLKDAGSGLGQGFRAKPPPQISYSK
jgi:hypothetical protein